MDVRGCAGAHGVDLQRGDAGTRQVERLARVLILGSGIVGWDGWMAVLRGSDWEGWAIEEIDYAPEPVTELRQGLEFYRTRLHRG